MKQSLREMVDSDRIPHALLLSGPQGLGKMLLTRALLQYIYCSDRRDGEPCGRCPACLQTAALNNPDIHWVFPVVKIKGKPTVSTDFYTEWKIMLEKHPYMEPEKWLDIIEAGNTRPVIYLDEANDIIRNAPLSSLSYRYKTYVIWLPEAMNLQAANTLLKLIEEPYPDTLFILVSDHPEDVLPTILSRTRRLNMRPVPPAAIEEWLRTRAGLTPSEAASSAAMAAGSPGKAIEFASNTGEQEEFGDIYRQMMRHAWKREVASLKELSEEIASMGREKNMRFLDYCSRMTRENFLCNFTLPPLNALSDEELRFSTHFAPFINYRNVENLITQTDRARRDISRNANAKIVMFDFMLSLCAIIRVQSGIKT